MRYYLCLKCMKYYKETSGEWINGKFYCGDCAPHDYEIDEGEK